MKNELKIASRIKKYPGILIGFLLKNDMRHDELRTLRDTIDGVIYNNRIAYKNIYLKQSIKGNIVKPGLVAVEKGKEDNENADFISMTDENDIDYMIYTAEIDNKRGMYL